MSGKSILSWQQYEEALDPLTKELSDAARWIQETGQRVVVLFEGRDTAGKGGSIDMFARALNPAPVPRRRAVVADRSRARPMVFPALRRALAAQGRNFAVRPQLVQSRRGRAGDGLLLRSRTEDFLARRSGVRAAPGRRRHPAVQILAVLRPGTAGGTVRKPAPQPAQAAGSCRRSISPRAIAMKPIPTRANNARRDPHRICAVDAGRFQRSGARPADAAARPARPRPRHRFAAQRHPVAAAAEPAGKERFGVLQPIPNYAAAADIAECFEKPSVKSTRQFARGNWR